MKKVLLLFLTLAVLFVFAACGSSALETPKNTIPQETTNAGGASNSALLYPLNTSETLYATCPSFPAIIFSTPASENGLSGTLYSFTGKMLGPYEGLDETYFVVETQFGNVLMMNIYYEIKDSMPIAEECYLTPKIGETARFTCIYDGFSEVAKMPTFAYGNDSFLLGIYSDSSEEPVTPEEPQKPEESQTPVIPTGKFNAEEVLSSLNITEHSYSSSYWHYGFLVIENTSNFNIKITADVKFYNKDNQLIGAESSSQEAFEKGSKIVLYFMPDEKFARMEYELSVKEEKYYDCVISDLSYESVSAKEKEIVSVTNNGSEPAEFVEGYALFFKGDQVVDFDSTYFTDDDSELKPGKTITKELRCYEDYDSVQFFLTGRR